MIEIFEKECITHAFLFLFSRQTQGWLLHLSDDSLPAFVVYESLIDLFSKGQKHMYHHNIVKQFLNMYADHPL
jgi:hypothetical protein